MVSASSAAAVQLTASAMTLIEPTASTDPKPSASPGIIRPAGSGRPLVRAIAASMSRSYHMLMAPAAPAPTAMQRTAIAARTGWSVPGARTRPAIAVKTTSDITRGFNSAMKSPIGGPSTRAAPAVSSIVLSATLSARP